VLANCGQLGLEWERVSLSGYSEAMEAQGEEPGKNHEPASDEFREWFKQRLAVD